MDLGFVIALVSLLLVVAVLSVGLVAVAVAAIVWTRRRPAPPPPPPVPVEADEAATEIFHRGSMLAFYDADEHDRTEALRLDGGILLDGRTDPAVAAERVVGPATGRKP